MNTLTIHFEHDEDAAAVIDMELDGKRVPWPFEGAGTWPLIDACDEAATEAMKYQAQKQREQSL